MPSSDERAEGAYLPQAAKVEMPEVRQSSDAAAELNQNAGQNCAPHMCVEKPGSWALSYVLQTMESSFSRNPVVVIGAGVAGLAPPSFRMVRNQTTTILK
jgi:hypothetical protein